MAIHVESGSKLAQAIQSAVQPKLMEAGWVADETDTTLSEYVTMMVVNGKTQEQVISELGTDLLGVGEDDPAVGTLALWLFQSLPKLHAEVTGEPLVDSSAQDTGTEQGNQDTQDNQEDAGTDAQMDDAAPASVIPSGPKAMRNATGPAGGRGRDRRMMGQLNRQMDRTQDGGIRKSRGAAGGPTGRIHPYANRDPPRGPRTNNVVTGMQRMMNGGPGYPPNSMAPGQQYGGGPQHFGPGPQQFGLTPQQFSGLPVDPQQQMQFMQMMEMQSQMMAQMFEQSAKNKPSGKSLFERVDKRSDGGFGKGGFGRGGQRGQHHIHNAPGNSESGAGMEIDEANAEDAEGKRGDPFDTICRYNTDCTVPTCPFAHQSPAAPPGTSVDLSDRCSFGVACENRKCSGKHPSPAQRRQQGKEDVDCKFYPNCTNLSCPFRHPGMPQCRNGADCTVPGCKFTHSSVMCRYDPCLNPGCLYRHTENHKRGNFEDKVWTASNTEKTNKTDRFKELSGHMEQEEELILPGRDSPETKEAVEA